jgi:hypothetical protein
VASDHRYFRRSCRAGVWIAAAILLSACVSHSGTFYYISLESDPDARVLERAAPAPRSRFWGEREVPVRYELVRDAYTLTLWTDLVSDGFWIFPDRTSPGISIHVKPNATRYLDPSDSKGPDGNACGTLEEPHRLSNVLHYRDGCGHGGAGSDMRIHFTVRDPDGNVVGVEAIPYTVEPNGRYFFVVNYLG